MGKFFNDVKALCLENYEKNCLEFQSWLSPLRDLSIIPVLEDIAEIIFFLPACNYFLRHLRFILLFDMLIQTDFASAKYIYY